MVDGKAVPLIECEVTYSVKFSDFTYDTTTYPNGVRQEGVILQLQYNDGTKNWTLENRFGGQMYGSGHYMQIGGTSSTLLEANAGAPFYSESVKNSVANFPALADGDVISLKVKCATGTENGYIKLLLNGEEKHSFVYTGTGLPEFGLKACKLMAKISDISLIVEGATGWGICTSHVESEQIVDVEPTNKLEGSWHTECTICGETINSGKIPATGGMELMDENASLVNQKDGVLTYDVTTQEGWIGGDGTTASTDQPERYFQYVAYDYVRVNGQVVPLTDCVVTYSVTFSDFVYDTTNYPSGVRQQGVILMLRYNDGDKTWKLENRFGGQMYNSGHYMQIGGTSSTLLEANAGAPFYSESVKNSVANFPALADGDVISLKVKCATGTENGYIKLLLNGEEKHSFVYTGTGLPEFGLKACKLMAKISKVSIYADGATEWITGSCTCENPEHDKVVTDATCVKPGYTTYTCKVCGISHTADEVAALGHNIENGICTVCGAKEWDTDGDGVLEILAFGNSFSVDALEYLWQIANNLGIEKIVIGNLNIGGCSLETHAANAAGDAAAYTYRYTDSGKWTNTSDYKISTALESRTWDYISLQQQSGKSGLADTYNEDLTSLIAYIKERSNAKLVWHMTWAYQQDSTHASFVNYNNDQMTMYNAIVSAVQSKISTNSNFALIVPNATAVQNSRTTLLGDTTTRDGYHMSTDYGRYLTGLMFFKTITGMSIDDITYVPAGVDGLELSYAIESVNNAYAQPFAVTQSTVVHPAGAAVKENVCEATCTSPATYDLVVYCSDCSVELSRTTVETAPALGHKFVDGVCSVCGKEEGLDLMSSASFVGKDGVLSYDVNKLQGWIGGDGTNASTDEPERYFSYLTYGDVLVNGKVVPLTDCEVTYSVTFSDFAYDRTTYPSGVRQQSVTLMLQYMDGTTEWDLENRFGGLIYDSGHYMQVWQDKKGKGDTMLTTVPGAPFYSETALSSNGKANSITNFPALKSGDTVSLVIKCAKGDEKGYIKLLLNGDLMHTMVYTGTTLPEFGLKAGKLMAKISNISLMVEGAKGWAVCTCKNPTVDAYTGEQSCEEGGTVSGLCTTCGNMHTKQLPPSDHTASEWIVDKEATTQYEGAQHKECTVCGKELESGKIPVITGLELIDGNANFYVTEGNDASDRISYDITTQTGWLGGDGTTPSTTTSDRYFTFPLYADVLVNGEAVSFTDCELVYSMVFSDFSYDADKHCRNSAVCLMLRYTDGNNVYKLENRFGGQIYASGHYMQVYVNGEGAGNVLQDTGAPFYSTVKNSFESVPALKSGDKLELKIKCANDTENGYIKLFLNGAMIGEFVYTGTEFPEFGLESMKLMAKVSNVSLVVNGATQWDSCACSMSDVKKYEITAEATCTADGHKSGKCVACGNLHSVVIPASHVEGKDWIVDQQANCTQDGSRHTECTVCGQHIQEEVIPATGHSAYWVEDKAATQLTAGSKHEECMVCKTVLSTQKIPAEGNLVLIIGGGCVLIAGVAVGIFFLVKSLRKKK